MNFCENILEEFPCEPIEFESDAVLQTTVFLSFLFIKVDSVGEVAHHKVDKLVDDESPSKVRAFPCVIF